MSRRQLETLNCSQGKKSGPELENQETSHFKAEAAKAGEARATPEPQAGPGGTGVMGWGRGGPVGRAC